MYCTYINNHYGLHKVAYKISQQSNNNTTQVKSLVINRIKINLKYKKCIFTCFYARVF